MNTMANRYSLKFISLLFTLCVLSSCAKKEASINNMTISITKSGGMAGICEKTIITNSKSTLQKDTGNETTYLLNDKDIERFSALIKNIESLPNIGNDNYADLFKYSIVITYNKKVVNKQFYELPDSNEYVIKYLNFIKGCLSICDLKGS